MQPKRRILIGAVGLVRGRVRGSGKVMVNICDELESVLKDTEFLKHAPFETVHLILYYGTKVDSTPKYQPIDKKHSELPITIELKMEELHMQPPEILKRIFMRATLLSLIDVGKKYKLPTEAFEKRLAELERPNA